MGKPRLDAVDRVPDRSGSNDLSRDRQVQIRPRLAQTDAGTVRPVIMGMFEREYQNPVRVVGFTSEKWSGDVCDVAHELRRRCDLQLRDVPFYLEELVEGHEGQLPLPMRLV